MIFAFDDKNEPDISVYNTGFKYTLDNAEDLGSVSNQDGYDKYRQDMETWNEKKQEGLNLFAEHYNNLWW